MTPLRDLFYWLDISGAHGEGYDAPVVEVVAQRSSNTIRVIRAGSWLRLLLDDRLVDMVSPVYIQTPEGETHAIGTLRASLPVAARTLLERGDPNYCFVAEVVLTCDHGVWHAS